MKVKPKRLLSILPMLCLLACNQKQAVVKPTLQNITESVYASGIVKGNNQYQAFAKIPGVVEKVFVQEGSTVKKGEPILLISNQAALYAKENAAATAQFNAKVQNQDKLTELAYNLDVLKEKMRNDSLLFQRQQNLFKEEVGTKAELELRELAYKNSLGAYEAAKSKYQQLKRQIAFSEKQAQLNLEISSAQYNDLLLRSEIEGRVYDILKQPGEMVNAQQPVAIIADANQFFLELLVDEYDIALLKVAQTVWVNMDSKKGNTFEARVSKIHPIMNERNRTFLVEATFVNQPEALYPNLSAEANIVIRQKNNALIIPRNLLVEETYVIMANGEKRKVKVGIKDYEKAEIIEGLSQDDELLATP